jgi:hypothetical protein
MATATGLEQIRTICQGIMDKKHDLKQRIRQNDVFSLVRIVKN